MVESKMENNLLTTNTLTYTLTTTLTAVNQRRTSGSTGLVAAVLLALVITITSLSAWSQSTPQLIPARFANTEGSLRSLLKMPSGIDNSDKLIGIACQAIVEPTGQAKNVNCFNELLSERDYVQVILDASREGTISPALVNRVPVRVLMNFSVLFICRDSNCNVIPLPHHNRYSEEYGLDEGARQAVLPKNAW